jgi:hypothetical protein
LLDGGVCMSSILMSVVTFARWLEYIFMLLDTQTHVHGYTPEGLGYCFGCGWGCKMTSSVHLVLQLLHSTGCWFWGCVLLPGTHTRLSCSLWPLSHDPTGHFASSQLGLSLWLFSSVSWVLGQAIRTGGGQWSVSGHWDQGAVGAEGLEKHLGKLAVMREQGTKMG